VINSGRDDIPVNSELGYCLEQLAKFEEALEYYKKAMKLGREDQWIYSRIGYICCCLKKYEESLEANLKAYELGENNILINSELGYSLGELQRFEEAITYYLKARELGREDKWIYFQMGWSYRHLEKYDKNNREVVIKYRLYDHFGLDTNDIFEHSGSFFIEWFVLQHFWGVKPFITEIVFTEKMKI